MNSPENTSLAKHERAAQRREKLFDLLEEYINEPDPSNEYSETSPEEAGQALWADVQCIVHATIGKKPKDTPQGQAYLVSTEGERHEDRLPKCILLGPEKNHLQGILKLIQKTFGEAKLSEIRVEDANLDYDPTGKQYSVWYPDDPEDPDDPEEFRDGDGITFLVEKIPTVRV